MILDSPVSFKSKRLLFISPHPDDDVIGCGALLFYFAKYSKDQRPRSINIAYATRGFAGVSDCYLQTRLANFQDFSEEEIRERKFEIRKSEALSCCEDLDAKPIFLNLPFYEKREGLISEKFSQEDVDIAKESIEKVNPDVIFLINEASDPHGTHGVVRSIFLEAIDKVKFSGTVIGYQVWKEMCEESLGESSRIIFSFDQNLMNEKIKLIRMHKSQIESPACPHEEHDFVSLAIKANRDMAKNLRDSMPFVECYSILSL